MREKTQIYLDGQNNTLKESGNMMDMLILETLLDIRSLLLDLVHR